MNHQYFVELLSRSGDIQQRFGFDELPIRIGRAYDNHIILDDPYTAAHHAQIDKNDDGTLAIRDLNTRNGILHRRKRLPELVLNDYTQVQLGHTHMRVRSRDFNVAEEITDSTNHRWEGWPPAVVGLILIIMQAIFSNWMGQTEKFEALEYFTQVATLLSAIVLWSGIWALLNRLFGGQTRLGRHLFIAACGMVIAESWSLLSVYLAYAFSLEFFTRYDTHINILIIVSVLFFHLITVAPLRQKRLFIVMVLLAVGGISLSLVNNYQNSGRLSDELYMHDLLPPDLRQSRDQSVDEFIQWAGDMRRRLDQAQQEDITIKKAETLLPDSADSPPDEPKPIDE